MALPTLTQTLDDAFTTTWYKIRKEAIDNILGANVVTAALREKGCFTPQVGESRIERTIRYGTKTATNVQKGDTLTTGEDKIETAALWDWKYSSVHVQRSLQDDQKNSGSVGKIKSLVNMKIGAAKDALNDKIESTLMAGIDTGGGTDLRAERDPNSIMNFLPGGSSYGEAAEYYTGANAAEVFGTIPFATNSWWRGQYEVGDSPAEVNLVENMKTLFNNCGKNKDYPDLIITNQLLFEQYENFALDMSQIIKGSGKMADLGFETLKFKGRDMIWSEDMPTINATSSNFLLMLNTKYIEVIYDPNVWFDMTEWKYIYNQLERITHIVMAWQLICTQLRRQGLCGLYS